MRRALPLLALTATAALLAGCSGAEPRVDLEAGSAWLDRVQAEQSDGPGAAGSASLLVGSRDDSDSGAIGHGVRLDFAGQAVLTRADARCFGGGTVAVTVRTVTAGATTPHEATIACDEQVHEIDLGGSAASTAAIVDGTANPPTYLFVALIQEMTIER